MRISIVAGRGRERGGPGERSDADRGRGGPSGGSEAGRGGGRGGPAYLPRRPLAFVDPAAADTGHCRSLPLRPLRHGGGGEGGRPSPRLLAGATRLLVLVLLVLVPRAALRAPAPPPPPLPMRAPRGQRRRRTCVPHARRGIVEDEHEITALRRYRITISYLSTSISNNNVISCRFDIVDGYRVVQLQYRVIQTNSPSHPLSSPRADRKSQQK